VQTFLSVVEKMKEFLVDQGMWWGIPRFEVLFGQPSHFIQARARGRFVYVLGGLQSCCKHCVTKTSRRNLKASLLHQQDVSGFRDLVFALGEDGIGVDSHHEKIAPLFW